MTQDFLPQMTLIVGTRQANRATIAEIRSRIDAVPGGKGPAVVTTLEQHLSRVAMAPERIAIVLVGASAAVALALGVLGFTEPWPTPSISDGASSVYAWRSGRRDGDWCDWSSPKEAGLPPPGPSPGCSCRASSPAGLHR